MTESHIIVNLFADYARECADQLRVAGYSVQGAPSDQDLILSYLNVRHRRVPVQPRAVHKANYTVPGPLARGESEFLKKVNDGRDLRPHQSTKLERPEFDDGMLNDFGINHFHLGTNPHPRKPVFVERTEPVLFALVKHHDFYSIGCYNHGSWSKEELLDVIHSNWPETIAGYSLEGELEQHITDQEHANLLGSGINVLTQRPDGVIHVPPGGGVALDGSSLSVSQKLISIRRELTTLETQVKTTVRRISESQPIQQPVHMRMVGRNGRAFLDSDCGRISIALPPWVLPEEI